MLVPLRANGVGDPDQRCELRCFGIGVVGRFKGEGRSVEDCGAVLDVVRVAGWGLVGRAREEEGRTG